MLILGIYTSNTHVHWVSSTIPHLIAFNYGNNRSFTSSKIYTSRQAPQGLRRTVYSRRWVRLVTQGCLCLCHRIGHWKKITQVSGAHFFKNFLSFFSLSRMTDSWEFVLGRVVFFIKPQNMLNFSFFLAQVCRLRDASCPSSATLRY